MCFHDEGDHVIHVNSHLTIYYEAILQLSWKSKRLHSFWTCIQSSKFRRTCLHLTNLPSWNNCGTIWNMANSLHVVFLECWCCQCLSSLWRWEVMICDQNIIITLAKIVLRGSFPCYFYSVLVGQTWLMPQTEWVHSSDSLEICKEAVKTGLPCLAPGSLIFIKELSRQHGEGAFIMLPWDPLVWNCFHVLLEYYKAVERNNLLLVNTYLCQKPLTRKPCLHFGSIITLICKLAYTVFI